METANPSLKALSFVSKAKYKLCIQGYIDPSWSERLGGLLITTSFSDDGKPMTTLEGILSDQSELIGILNSIYEMHLPLISVSFVKAL